MLYVCREKALIHTINVLLLRLVIVINKTNDEKFEDMFSFIWYVCSAYVCLYLFISQRAMIMLVS
jgi:hypothetical protein